jgi:hypothetical protein
LACPSAPDACRRDHVAARLDGARADGTDFEARCPACGHGGFRISRADRSKRLRHIWTCNCGRCGGTCAPRDIRDALLSLGIGRDCLGAYDGNAPKAIPPDAAKRQELAIRDIIATPHLKPADMRLVLAEALGWTIPADYTEFVKVAKRAGIGHQQAYEAARRWLGRPPDCPPLTGGEVVDTSRSTEPRADVKPRRPKHRKPTETVEPAYENRSDSPVAVPTENVERTLDDKSNRRPAA